MGFFGCGMQDSDQALDAIFVVSDYNYDTGKKTLKPNLPPFSEIFAQLAAKVSYPNIQVLGVAEWLLEYGFTPSDLPLDIIDNALAKELAYGELKHWDRPEEREAELKKFAEKLKV